MLTEEKDVPEGDYEAWYWGRWWLEIGGYCDLTQLDANGMSALMHACDQKLWSARAGLATDDLIQMATEAQINQVINTNNYGFPDGWRSIHLLASGVDRNRFRPGLMEALIDRGPDIEAVTLSAPGNTAMTLAAGQGCGTMWTVLEAAGADTRYTNENGKGMMELAKCCSSTVRALTKAAHVPDTCVPKTRERCV
jgi:hypothetical protein